ncbi:hypothetical protein [Hyphomonas sp.]|uniref:hypothetical protein n=1 Tax=Hyphomonas sp. TaxID=87 RepID=UPI003D2AB15D
MLRLISILLLLGGIAIAGIGGAALMEEFRPREPVAMSVESEPVLMSEAPEEAAPAPEVMTDSAPPPPPPVAAMEAPPEVDAAPIRPTARASGPRTRSLASGPAEDDLASVASADDGFSAADTEEAFDAFSDTSEAFAESAGVAAPEPQQSRAAAFLETLQTVPVAHETPTSAEYKRAFDVTLAIDATGDDTAADALPGRGNVVTGEARVSDRVEARVSGANFEIVPMSPGIQSLSPLTENVWRWSVMPLSAGDHDLVFEIYAIDQDSVVPLRTFRDTVTVQVSGINRAIAFADQANPLFVLLGGLGSAIAGLLGAVKFFGRR